MLCRIKIGCTKGVQDETRVVLVAVSMRGCEVRGEYRA